MKGEMFQDTFNCMFVPEVWISNIRGMLSL